MSEVNNGPDYLYNLGLLEGDVVKSGVGHLLDVGLHKRELAVFVDEGKPVMFVADSESPSWEVVSRASDNDTKEKEDKASDGGPSEYYDVFPEVITTANDAIEHLSKNIWLAYSCHMKDIFKAITRWGSKKGTTREYDAKKIVYSGARLLIMLSGRKATREYLQELIDDPQFKEIE